MYFKLLFFHIVLLVAIFSTLSSLPNIGRTISCNSSNMPYLLLINQVTIHPFLLFLLYYLASMKNTLTSPCLKKRACCGIGKNDTWLDILKLSILIYLVIISQHIYVLNHHFTCVLIPLFMAEVTLKSFYNLSAIISNFFKYKQLLNFSVVQGLSTFIGTHCNSSSMLLFS